MRACIKNTERSQINNLMLYLTLLEKQQAKPKTIRRREILKIRTEINKKGTIKRINEPKFFFFEKINKIDKPLANLTKMRKQPKLIKLETKKKGRSQQAPRKSRELLGIILKTYIQNKLENLEERDKFLDTYNIQI
jgi:hypothetical protein